nr:hypothetical protein [Streptomyces klenkii]
MHGVPGVSAEAHRNALKLAEWVGRGKIIIPASAGHFHETTKRFDHEKRYRLGLTILQLSLGWQMLDPLQVWRNELHEIFHCRSGEGGSVRSQGVFTLASNAIYASRGMDSFRAPPDWSPESAFQLETLTAVTAAIDVMLDAERNEPGPDTGWVAANQRFSDWLDSQDWDAQQKRRAVNAFLLADLRREIAEQAHAAGVNVGEFQQWILKHAAKEIGQLPAVGLYREMHYGRHLNKGIKWVPNDLTDMVYLSCAAGYADFVVCERHMCAFLTQGIRRLKGATPVFRRLSDAVAAIEAALESPRGTAQSGASPDEHEAG